jgi:hypothetical protein
MTLRVGLVVKVGIWDAVGDEASIALVLGTVYVLESFVGFARSEEDSDSREIRSFFKVLAV